MAVEEDLLQMEPKRFGRLQDHFGNLEHHAEECNQIDASHAEVDDYQAHLKLVSLGYKFDPDDYQLIVRFLKPKVDHRPLPHYLIKEVTLYDINPMILSEMFKPIGNAWYFFTPIKRKYLNGNVADRNACEGYWKSTGREVRISFKDTSLKDVPVGYKRTLVFYKGKRPGRKTNWIMHEYKVADPPQRTKEGPNDKRLDDFVVCKLYLRTTNSDSERSNDIGLLKRNTEDVTFNTPERENFGSNDTMFDDSTLLSQQLKQNTNINSFLYATNNVTTNFGIAKNNDAWILEKDGVSSQPLEQNASINPHASVAMNVENAGINILENVDIEFSQYSQDVIENVDVELNQYFQDALENVELNQYFQDAVENVELNQYYQYFQDVVENVNVGLNQYLQGELSEFQTGGEAPFSPHRADIFPLHNEGHQVQPSELPWNKFWRTTDF